VADSSTRDN
jgi:hypothetical protein